MTRNTESHYRIRQLVARVRMGTRMPHSAQMPGPLGSSKPPSHPANQGSWRTLSVTLVICYDPGCRNRAFDSRLALAYFIATLQC